MLAFVAGVAAGVLLASAGWRAFPSAPIQAVAQAQRSWDVLESVRSGLTNLVYPQGSSARPRTYRWAVTNRVRMATSNVTLARNLPQAVDQAPKTAPAVIPSSSTPSEAPSQTPPPQVVPPSRVATKPPAAVERPEAWYDRALKLYEAGRHDQARAEFTRFLAAHPGHRLAVNALYWSGETCYSQGRYDQATGYFSRVARDYPRHDKSPDALLKLAYTALRQGQGDQARAYLDQLQVRYPQSRASRLGRDARARLQGDNGPVLAVAVRE